ncbi:hypothetical protein PT2222_110171 [Paraburkholderia tropica]
MSSFVSFVGLPALQRRLARGVGRSERCCDSSNNSSVGPGHAIDLDQSSAYAENPHTARLNPIAVPDCPTKVLFSLEPGTAMLAPHSAG